MGFVGLREYNKRPQFVELHCKLADVSNVTRSLQWFSGGFHEACNQRVGVGV